MASAHADPAPDQVCQKPYGAEDAAVATREAARNAADLLPTVLAEGAAPRGTGVSLLYAALPPECAAQAVDAHSRCCLHLCKEAVRLAAAAAEGRCSPQEADHVLMRPLQAAVDARLGATPTQKALLVHALLAIACGAGKDTGLARSALGRVQTIVPLRRPLDLRSGLPPGTVIDERLICCIIERFWFRQSRLRSAPLPRLLDAGLGKVATRLSHYFPPGAHERIWRRYRPMLCPHFHVRMFRSLSCLLHLLPLRRISQEWFDDLMTLVGLSTETVWVSELMAFVNRVAEAEVTGGLHGPMRCSVLPHADSIYGHVLKCVKVIYDGKDDNTLLLGKGTGNNKKDMLMHHSGAVCSLIFRLQIGSLGLAEAKRRLARLFQALDNFMGRCTEKADLFVYVFCSSVKNQVHEELLRAGGPAADDADDEDPADFAAALGTAVVAECPSELPAVPSASAAAAAELTRELPLRELREGCAEVVLPHALNLLMNEKEPIAARSGATCAISLLVIHPEVALPQVLERARLTASIATSAVRYNPVLLEALLQCTLSSGSDEDLAWVLGRVLELVGAAHARAQPHAMRMISYVCATTPLRTEKLQDWGLAVWKEFIAIAATTETAAQFPCAAALLCAAFPAERQEEVCREVEAAILSKVHSQETKKTHVLRSFASLCRGCAGARPAWARRAAELLLDRILSPDAPDVMLQWCAHLLSKVLCMLGSSLLEISGRVCDAVQLLLFGEREDDWRLKEGGHLLKNLVWGLTRFYPLDWRPPAVAEGRQGFVGIAEARIAWHLPSAGELSHAAQLLLRWAPSVLSSVAATAESGWQGKEALATRLLYLVKAGRRFFRAELQALAADSGEPFAIPDTAAEAAGAALREAGCSVRHLAGALTAALIDRRGGCTERVATALCKAHQALQYDRRDQRDESATQVATDILRQIGWRVHSRRCMPRGAVALLAWNRYILLQSCWDTVRRRSDLEGALLQVQCRMAALGLDKIRSRAGNLHATCLLRHHHTADHTGTSLSYALSLIERAPAAPAAAAEEAALADEHAALGGLSLVNRFETMLRIFRDWQLLQRFCRVMLRVGYDSRKELRDKVDAAFSTGFRSTRATHACTLPVNTSSDEVRELLTQLVVLAEGERSRRESLVGPGEDEDDDDDDDIADEGCPATRHRVQRRGRPAPPPAAAGGAEEKPRPSGGRHAATKRATRMLSVLCRACPEVDGGSDQWVPQPVVLYFLNNLDHPLTSVRSTCRDALSSCLLRLKRRVPRRLVASYSECSTTSAVPSLQKQYDYEAALPPDEAARETVGVVVRSGFVERVLSFDEHNDYALQEALREERASFDWWTAQTWKGMFQILEDRLLSVVERVAGDGDFVIRHSRQQAEVVGGLLRACRHWHRPGQEELRARTWAFVLSRLRIVLSAGVERALKDFEAALCYGACSHPRLEPLEDFLLDHMGAAAGLQSQVVMLQLVGNYLRGLQRMPQHLAFVARLIGTLQHCGLQVEFERVRSKLSVLNAMLFHLVFCMPQRPHKQLSDYLATTLAPTSTHTAKIVLGTVYSVASTGRVLALAPYLATFADAFAYAAQAREEHCDDGELVNLLTYAVRGFLRASYSTQSLRCLIDVLRHVSSENLCRKRGRAMVCQIVDVVALNSYTLLGDREVEEAVRAALSHMLQSHTREAAADAAGCVQTIAKVSDDEALARWTAAFAAWGESDRAIMRRAAATGLKGLALARTYNANAATWQHLRALLALAGDKRSPEVRRTAADGAVAWRQAVREQQCVWRKIEPELSSQGLLAPLAATESTSTAGFA